MHGRLDEAYRTPAGELLLVDTKTRERFRVYDTDVAELSTYAYICRANGHRVLP